MSAGRKSGHCPRGEALPNLTSRQRLARDPLNSRQRMGLKKEEKKAKTKRMLVNDLLKKINDREPYIRHKTNVLRE